MSRLEKSSIGRSIRPPQTPTLFKIIFHGDVPRNDGVSALTGSGIRIMLMK